MKIAKIIIEDEVNISVKGLELAERRQCVNALKYFIPGARYSAAFKLGRWDGTKSFMTIGGRTYLNLLDRILPIIQTAGYEIELEDQRPAFDFSLKTIDENYHAGKTWPAGHRFEGQPIVLRDYQVEIINHFVEGPQSIYVAATGAGKTLVTATLSSIVEPWGRSIVIVPNINLVEQTEKDYVNLGLDVGVLYGDRKEYDRTHTICTWQSLSVLDKKSKDCLDDGQLAVFMKDLVCVICDEVHMSKAEVLFKLLTHNFANIPLRWGLTGTLPELEQDKFSLLAALGPVVGELPAHELQAQGVLANCHVNILQTRETQVFGKYPDELKFLTTNEARLKWLADRIMLIKDSGNTVVLVDRIETGKRLAELIPNSVFVSGSVKTAKRSEAYDSIRVADDQVVIATFGVAAVGLDIPRIFNLVMVEPGKSFIRVIQSIGRGLRMANDKDHAMIYDITSTCKFSKRHLTARKKHYDSAKYPYTTEKINYLI